MKVVKTSTIPVSMRIKEIMVNHSISMQMNGMTSPKKKQLQIPFFDKPTRA